MSRLLMSKKISTSIIVFLLTLTHLAQADLKGDEPNQLQAIAQIRQMIEEHKLMNWEEIQADVIRRHSELRSLRDKGYTNNSLKLIELSESELTEKLNPMNKDLFIAKEYSELSKLYDGLVRITQIQAVESESIRNQPETPIHKFLDVQVKLFKSMGPFALIADGVVLPIYAPLAILGLVLGI